MNLIRLGKTIRSGAIVGLCAYVSSAAAQDGVSDSEEIFTLSPFEVNASNDAGYRATNSISGTRLNAEIKDVPLNLEVITSEFIKDTGAKDLRESLRYSAGVVLESQSDAFVEPDGDSASAGANDPRGATRSQGDSTTKLRGFVINQVLRDGFRRQYSADSINIGRVEVVRGPSALLYGVGSFGGVINYLPKMPSRDASFYSGASIGSHGLFRSEFDVTGAIGGDEKGGAYRVTGSYQEGGDYTEHYNNKTYFIAPIFTFKPFENTTIVFDNEIGYNEQRGVGFQNIRSNLNTAASRTAGWLTDTADGLIDDRTFRWSGPDTYQKGPFNNHVLDITQKFGDNLHAKLGYSYTSATFDSRQIRNTGTRAEAFSISDPLSYDEDASVLIDGTEYNLRTAVSDAVSNDNDFMGLSVFDLYARRASGDFRGDSLYGFVENNPIESQIRPGPPSTIDSAALYYEWNDTNRTDRREQVRFDLNYQFRTGEWGTHNIIVGSQYMGLRGEEDFFAPPQSTTSTPITDVERLSYRNPEDYSYFRYGLQGDGRPDAPRTHIYHKENETWDMGYYGVYQGKFLNERLMVIAGLRRDRNDRYAETDYIWDADRENSIESRVQAEAPTATSPQYGVSYAINDQLTVFGLYSTGVVPNYYDRDGLGNAFDPTKAVNREIGVKFDLLEGKLSGTVSAYEIERKNTPKYLWWAPSPYKSVENGYNPDSPAAAPWSHAGPESLWYAMHNVDNGLAVAKEIYGEAWHSTFDAIAAHPFSEDGPGDAFYEIDGVARWWSYDRDESNMRGLSREAESTFWSNAEPLNGVWFPLVDFSDPEHAAFAKSAKVDAPYWGGNWYYDSGHSYYFGDGSTGGGNAPDGSGASVGLNDEAKGWDLSLIYTPTDSISAVLNFAHVERRITTQTYDFVEAPYWPFAWWYVQDGFFGTLDYERTVEEAYADVTDTTTYRAPIPEYDQVADDTPENSASFWVRYSLQNVAPLQNFTVGLGGYWEDKRQWFTGFTGGGGNITTTENDDGERELVQLWTEDRITLNGFVEYKTTVSEKYDLRVALNVDNFLNDQDEYGQIYARGMSWRLSTGLSF